MILSEFSAVFSGNEEDDKYMSRMISRLPLRTYNDKQNQPTCQTSDNNQGVTMR